MGRQRVTGSTPRGIVRTQQRQRAFSPEGLSHACPFSARGGPLILPAGRGLGATGVTPELMFWLLRSPMKGGRGQNEAGLGILQSSIHHLAPAKVRGTTHESTREPAASAAAAAAAAAAVTSAATA
jgi:hypothetical protein